MAKHDIACTCPGVQTGCSDNEVVESVPIDVTCRMDGDTCPTGSDAIQTEAIVAAERIERDGWVECR